MKENDWLDSTVSTSHVNSVSLVRIFRQSASSVVVVCGVDPYPRLIIYRLTALMSRVGWSGIFLCWRRAFSSESDTAYFPEPL